MASQHLSLPDDHVGLYIHIPFCVRKCRYCDFASGPVGDGAIVDRYLDALAVEAAWAREQYPRPVSSIFIGGGTPTTLTGAQLRRLWEEILAPFPRSADAEITIEANPGTLTDDVLAGLAAIPLTRVSLGVQSFDPAELALLGRIHSAEEAEAGVVAIRDALPTAQINLDLIYALPDQTAMDWERSLCRALALAPDHLSLYSLILEEGTPLTTAVMAGDCPEPDELAEEEMAARTAVMLAESGYTHYEVSNAALPGRHSRHNLGYWLGRDYLGLGSAATSTVGPVRWRAVESPVEYVDRITAGRPVTAYAERLSARERLLERVMLGLRLREGFNLPQAEAQCGATLDSPAYRELLDNGSLERGGEILRLSPVAYRLANSVVAHLIG